MEVEKIVCRFFADMTAHFLRSSQLVSRELRGGKSWLHSTVQTLLKWNVQALIMQPGRKDKLSYYSEVLFALKN